jgi:hypothetical protein
VSYADALPGILARVARALNVNAETARAEMYGLLERNRVGRGRVYTHYLRTNPRTGVVYPVAERPTPHRASAPGDAPARDTGRLMESVAVTKRATASDLVAEIGPRQQAFAEAFYPGFLEYGTRKIAPRPFIAPTASRVKELFKNGGFRVEGPS